ncbi:MAG: ribosomal protein S18-alanine N-acetyltransferase [Candidatus Marsarchaeota archaeon]
MELTELSPVAFRSCRPEDLDEVIKINEICLPENYPRSFFVEHLVNFPKAFIVAETEGKIVGYVMTRVEKGFSFFGMKWVTKAHIISLAVLPQYRRRGIGTALMRKAHEGAREYGATEIYLEVRVNNQEAIALYKKLSYEIKDVNTNYYSDGEDAYIMVARL